MPFPSLAKITKAVTYHVEKGAIDAACLVTSDQYTVALAENTVLAGKPQARAMLDNYLTGGGDKVVKTAELFQADPAVASFFLKTVREQMAAGKTSGSVPIAQSVYSNQDWRNALGGINLQWKTISKGVIETWFINRYRWHPGEARISQCVHQAAENLKSAGAREFDIIGTHYQLNP